MLFIRIVLEFIYNTIMLLQGWKKKNKQPCLVLSSRTVLMLLHWSYPVNVYRLRGAVENVSFPSLSVLSVFEWNRPSSLLRCWNVIFWQSDWLSVGFWTHFLSFFASGRQMMEFVHESMCVHPYVLFPASHFSMFFSTDMESCGHMSHNDSSVSCCLFVTKMHWPHQHNQRLWLYCL